MHHGIVKTPVLWTYLTSFAGQIAPWCVYVYLQAGIYNSGDYILITKLIKVTACTEAQYLHIYIFIASTLHTLITTCFCIQIRLKYTLQHSYSINHLFSSPIV